MSVYHFKESKVIDEVTFRRSQGGGRRAYVHAVDGVSNDELTQIERKLKSRGWQCTPYTFNSKPTLEVRDFGKEPDFIEFLESQKWAQGQAWRKAEESDHVSFKDKVKQKSLWAATASFIVADIGFMLYGFKEMSKLDFAGGSSYLSGTLAGLILSRKDQSDIQIKSVAKELKRHFDERDLHAPKDSALSEASEDPKDLVKRADNWLRKYPSEAMNLIYVVAGACIATAAYKEKVREAHHFLEGNLQGTFKRDVEEYLERDLKNLRKIDSGYEFTETIRVTRSQQLKEKLNRDYKREGWMDIGLGSTTMASGLFGAFVTEKKPDPDSPKKKGLAKAWEWMQEKPLKVSAIGYMGSTACHAVSTGVAWTSGIPRRRESVPFRAAFIAFTTLGEILLMISSKGHGHGVKTDTSIDDTTISMAAEIIAKQPAAMHNLLINETAKVIARPEVLALKDEEAVDKLRKQVELMRNNPWAQTQDLSVKQGTSSKNDTVQAAPPAAEKAVDPTTTTRKMAAPQANWIDKMAVKEQPVGLQP